MLDTTSLVHEFYIRLAESGKLQMADWPEFFRYASGCMRNLIVDSIRRRNARRHGGGIQNVSLRDDDMAPRGAGGEEEILAVHQALEQLESIDGRMARIVEMRYFGGMSEEEIAAALELTSRTIRREWHKAQLLLAHALR